jgi:hypothetical protein
MDRPSDDRDGGAERPPFSGDHVEWQTSFYVIILISYLPK